MQFTMRREYEKAKEEAELIRQLRSVSSPLTLISLFLMKVKVHFITAQFFIRQLMLTRMIH